MLEYGGVNRLLIDVLAVCNAGKPTSARGGYNPLLLRRPKRIDVGVAVDSW